MHVDWASTHPIGKLVAPSTCLRDHFGNVTSSGCARNVCMRGVVGKAKSCGASPCLWVVLQNGDICGCCSRL